MAHALLAPSAAHRWVRCPASVVMSLTEESTSSEHAAMGTVAHQIAQECLIAGIDAAGHIGRIVSDSGFTFEIDKPFADHVQTYLDYVRRGAAQPGASLLIEYRVPIAAITGEAGAHGTADAIILHNGVLHIIDLKFGMGVRVNAFNNWQLLIYAAGAYAFAALVETITDVRLHIVQPRLDHIDSWELPVKALERFTAEVTAAAARCHQALQRLEEAHFDPGHKQCQWCPAKADCKHLATFLLREVQGEFNNLNSLDSEEPLKTLDPNSLTPAQLARCLTMAPLLEDWCRAIRAKVEANLVVGDHVPGYKLVQGRAGVRKWTDEQAVLALFGEEAQTVSLKSPAQLEKVFKGTDAWEQAQPLITQTEGKPSVAPIADPRPALPLAATANDFDHLLDQEE